MDIRVFISLFDRQDAEKIITFFKRRKFDVSNFMRNSFDCVRNQSRYKCVGEVYTDNFSLGEVLGLSLYRYDGSYVNYEKTIDKIIADLKASSFPYFMVVVDSDDYIAADHGHLIAKANQHVEVKRVEVIEQIIKKKPQAKKPSKIASKPSARSAKKAPRKSVII